jgi:hypothetical protein
MSSRRQSPTLKFSPVLQVFYSETVLPMQDGVPTFKAFPKELGGSGEQIVD